VRRLLLSARAAWPAAIALLLAGCAADRVTGVKAPTAPLLAVTDQVPGCAFTIKSIEDRREDKSLGTLVRTKVDGRGFTNWFADGMAAIPGHSASDASTALQIEVLKAYVHGISTLKSANLVVRVTAIGAAGEQRQSTYRGVDGSTNWNSSEDEVQSAFNLALADLQRQIGTDLRKHCKPD